MNTATIEQQVTAVAIRDRSELALAAMEKTIAGYEQEAETLVVADADGYALATGFVNEMREAEKFLNDPKAGLRKRILKPFEDDVKRINAFFKGPLDRLAAARETMRQKIKKHLQAVEAENRRIADEKRKAAEKAEQDARDAARKAEEEAAEAQRKAADEAANTPEAKAAAQKAADEAAAAVRKANELAEQALIDAANAQVVTEQKSHKTDLGSSGLTKVWKWRQVNFAAVPDEWKMLDEVKINKATRPKDGLRVIPGLEIYEDSQLATWR
ncbi:MAG: hypothetical protein ABIK07_25865 [Planctomycetota bacterium]